MRVSISDNNWTYFCTTTRDLANEAEIEANRQLVFSWEVLLDATSVIKIENDEQKDLKKGEELKEKKEEKIKPLATKKEE